MAAIDSAIGSLDALERLASQDSPVHRLDPRAKMIATAMFVVTAVSFHKHEIGEMLPLFLYVAVFSAVGRVPARVILHYLVLASPFVLLVGAFNPLLDRETAFWLGPLAVSGGWLSFASILIRCGLTVSSVVLLLACTGYVQLCAALGRLGTPRALVTQFLMLYKFIFILSDEAARMVRAHSLRSLGGRGPTLRVWGSLAGHLLLRAYDRGARVHAAMLARGFDGTMPTAREYRWSWADSSFVLGCGAFFALVRFGRVAELLGRWTMEVSS